LSAPDSLEIYTVTFLKHADHYLLLQRNAAKTFAPRRWTGIGGHVEADELSRLRASALREIYEETGIVESEIQNFVLRRVLLTNRPGPALGIVLYYTGLLEESVLPPSPEGELHWVRVEDFNGLDIIETTSLVLDLLVEDLRNDPQGIRPVATGLGIFESQGSFRGVVWGEMNLGKE
jgi:8-oxo-dGTP diphosphatase